MRVHNPSIETIKEQLDSRYHLLDKVYALIWSYMRASGLYDAKGETIDPDKAHEEIDALLGNHGVESIRFKYRGQIKTLYYSNTGDTYEQTVLRFDNTYGGVRYVTWFVGCWGDIAENPNYKAVE